MSMRNATRPAFASACGCTARASTVCRFRELDESLALARGELRADALQAGDNLAGNVLAILDVTGDQIRQRNRVAGNTISFAG